MSKAVFKDYSQGQICMFPVSLEDKIPANAPVRPGNQIVDRLDISKGMNSYKGGGTSSYHPRMMLKSVLFSYRKTVQQSREYVQKAGKVVDLCQKHIRFYACGLFMAKKIRIKEF